MLYNLFSKIWGPPEEPYTRPSLQLDLTESIDTNATAPNNPGPGRNVGRLYDALGARLEHFLGRTAGRGRGRPSLTPNLHLPVLLDRNDSIDTNATGPNNPGPGRNVGRLFDAVGTRIEHLLNKSAGRLKLGPEAVAEEIRNLRRFRETFVLPVGHNGDGAVLPTDREVRTLKRLCRRLLKYCRSQELATQLKALNEVSALAIEDPYVRGLLVGVRSHPYLLPKYKESELYLSSIKAVISIKDNEIHELWSHYSQLMSRTKITPNDPDIIGLENRLTMHLSNPDVSFLVARHLRKSIDDVFFFHRLWRAWEYYIQVAISKPELIEWDSLNILFSHRSRDTENFVTSHASQIIQ